VAISIDNNSGFGVIGPDGFIHERRESKFCLGLDIGQSIDPSAISILERVREPLPVVGADLIVHLGPPEYRLVGLKRLPLGMSYIAQVSYVSSLLNRPPLRGNCRLALDISGCGRPVGELFSSLNPVCVTITGGDNETRAPDNSGWHVAKRILVSRLLALLHAGELKIAKKMPEAAALVNELQNFRVNISDAGIDTYGARSGKHDDLVLSLAIAAWYLVGPRAVGSIRAERWPV
jgi:hypothetical protein